MKLSDIAKRVLNEDTNLPANQPATSVPTEAAPKVYDVLQDYQNFENVLEKQIETAKNGLVSTLSKNLLNKSVTCRASKGAIGQIEKDYTILVTGIEISQMKEDYYIVLKDKEKKDYYINTAFKMKVSEPGTESPASKESDSPQASIIQPPENNSYSKQAGAIKYPQNMGLSSNKPPAK